MRYFQINSIMYACAGYAFIPDVNGFYVRMLGTDMRCFFKFQEIEEITQERNRAFMLGKEIDGIKIDTKTQTYEIVYK